MDSKYLAGCLDEITEACENIKDKELCVECPMYHCCIEDTPLADIAYDCPRSHFDEIIEMGKDPEWYVMSEDEKDEIKRQLI